MRFLHVSDPPLTATTDLIPHSGIQNGREKTRCVWRARCEWTLGVYLKLRQHHGCITDALTVEYHEDFLIESTG